MEEWLYMRDSEIPSTCLILPQTVMEALSQVFQAKKAEVCPTTPLPPHPFDTPQGVAAIVTFVTAGYPTIDDTVPILLGMQAGGVDIIELGVPFSDPIADGPVIQESNTVCPTIISRVQVSPDSFSGCLKARCRLYYCPRDPQGSPQPRTQSPRHAHG